MSSSHVMPYDNHQHQQYQQQHHNNQQQQQQYHPYQHHRRATGNKNNGPTISIHELTKGDKIELQTEIGAVRGIYTPEEEKIAPFNAYLYQDTSNGSNDNENDEYKKKRFLTIPTFSSKAECMEWVNKYSKDSSNPEIPDLKHIFTHLIGWNQVNKYIIVNKLMKHVVRQYIFKSQDKPQDILAIKASELYQRNRYYYDDNMDKEHMINTIDDIKSVMDGVTRRLDLPIHQKLNYESTMNTLKYCFFHMRCGIIVSIRNGKLVLFAPFVNDEYRNNWAHYLKTEPQNFTTYYQKKSNYYRKENIIPDVSQWWANGNIICNEHQEPKEKVNQWWGDHLLAPFKHMLETLCSEREIPDVDFFFNKRDYPQLKANLTEPYDFCFDQMDVPLDSSEFISQIDSANASALTQQLKIKSKFSTYAPILSFYCSDNFADLPIPTTEDWIGAIGKVFPDTFIPDHDGKIKEPSDLYTEENFAKFYRPWEEKVNTAFFRGNATGGGTTVENNQRLRLAYIANEIIKEHPNIIDAGITGYNCRDKKMFGLPMQFLQNDKLPFQKSGFIPMYEQSKYKYILYVQGHCAANRYAFLMRLGSVIFKVDSTCEAKDLWFFPLLKPYRGVGQAERVPVELDGADHIPIKADLSDLKETLLWCAQNDEICKAIAENCKRRYDRCISKDAILDYMEMLLLKMASHYEKAPMWWEPPRATPINCPNIPPGNFSHPKPNKRNRDEDDDEKEQLCARCDEYRKDLSNMSS